MSKIEYTIENHEGVRGARAKYLDLQIQYNEVDTRISNLNAEDRSKEFKTLKEKKIAALLDGKDPDEIKQADWREAYEKACDRRKLLLAAIEEQRKQVEEQERLASKIEAERAKPDYEAIVREQSEKLIEIGKVMEKEIAFRDALRQGEVQYSGYFTPMFISALGDPRDRWSRFAMTLIDAVERGYISEKDIPQEWRDKWHHVLMWEPL